MTKGTRLRILQILQKNGNETVKGLASSTGLSAETLRRHLDILQRDRLVACNVVRKETGRPSFYFHLTEEGQEALPKGYDRLLGMIINELASLTSEDTEMRSGEQILGFIFQRLSEQAARKHAVEVDGKDLAYRLGTLLRLLRKEEFSPEATVVDGILRIRLLNCPFRTVALQNRAVCSFDAGLISAVLNTDLSREECIQDGHSCCTYSAYIGAEQISEFPSRSADVDFGNQGLDKSRVIGTR